MDKGLEIKEQHHNNNKSTSPWALVYYMMKIAYRLNAIIELRSI